MWIEPLNNRILVLPDIPPSKVGEIHLPENIERPASAGTIVHSAIGVSSSFLPGRRVLFMHYAGRGYTIDGVEHKVMGTSEVIAFEWELENKIEAHPNQILIRRDDQGIQHGANIILPDSARQAKSVMATVVAVGKYLAMTTQFLCGERLIISAGVGRKVKIDGQYLYACSPTEIIARVHEGASDIKDIGEASEGRYKEAMEGLVYSRDEGLRDEGLVK